MGPYNLVWGYIYIHYQVHRCCPVLKVIDIFADYLAIDDKNTSAINHYGNHVNRIILRIGEFERGFTTLDIKCKYLGIGGSENVRLTSYCNNTAIGNNIVPTTYTHVEIDADTGKVGNVVFANVCYLG